MTRLVQIGNERISLHLALPDRGMPEILSFGHVAVSQGVSPVAERASRINGTDVSVPSAVLLPAGGMGFFGWPAIAGHRDGRDFTVEFSGWQVGAHTGRTVLAARDAETKLSLDIEIEVFETGVLSISTLLRNDGDTPYTLDRCMAASVLVDAGPAELTSFSGMWGREFQTRTQALGAGTWLQESRRGRTSHDRFPGLFISTGGQTAALHLGWSGNHLVAIDTLDDGRRLIHAGELFEPGEMRLAPGASYQSPKAYLSAGPDVEAVSQCLRDFVSSTLIDWPSGTKARPRPVTLNTWEGNYFDHRLEHLKAQADAAATLGIERFVLDDGWFGKRDDDTSSLGDWTVDPRKYPDGLKPLVDHVTGLGMEFGLWFEPEMVNADSDLYRAHPDWVLRVDGRPLLAARNQLVLDLTRTEVADYLFDCLNRVLGAHAIAYVKWDMNRDLTHAGGHDGRAATAAQTRAVYALLDRVRAAHPTVEIESCASGGGRADYGVLARTQRIWTSDCTDALDRLSIQRGAGLFFPPHILGAHVSASPNHQTHRRHSLAFRAIVALAYHFGVELNPLSLEAGERDELAGWIALHKRLRPDLHGGRFFQHAPLDGRYVWGVSTPCKIVVFVAQAMQMLAEQPPPLRLALAPEAADGEWRIAGMHPVLPDFFRVSDGQKKLLAGEIRFGAQTLRRSGLPLPMLRPESGVILEIETAGGG